MRVSYGVYVWHILVAYAFGPLLDATGLTTQKHDILRCAFLTVASVGVAWLSWIAIERPFIEWTRRATAPEGLWQNARTRLTKVLRPHAAGLGEQRRQQSPGNRLDSAGGFSLFQSPHVPRGSQQPRLHPRIRRSHGYCSPWTHRSETLPRTDRFGRNGPGELGRHRGGCRFPEAARGQGPLHYSLHHIFSSSTIFPCPSWLDGFRN